MPKRAWCSGCRSYVMLTADDMCPYGHPKPSLRGVEEVGYGAPPSHVELRAGTPSPAPYNSQGYASATTTSRDSFNSAAVYGSGATSSGYDGMAVAAAPAYGGGDYSSTGGAYGGGFGASEPVGGFGAPAAPAAAVAIPSPAFQAPDGSANPWQSEINAVRLDPVLQTQLPMDADRINRNVPWSQSWPGMLVWLFIFTPVGLFFLWRSPIPKSSEKWAITGVYAGIVIFSVARVWLAIMATAVHAAAAHP